jgi:nicotinamidase/pyrazinamidase
MEGPREALLVIDMLNDFCREGASLFVPATREVIPNIQRELKRARAEGVPVVYICDAHDPADIEFNNWPAHAVEGSEGARVIDELKPSGRDIVVHKKSLLGFYKTDLDLEKELHGLGVGQVTVTGCVTNICVMLIAIEAAVRGFKVRVPRDCAAGLDTDMHEFALKELELVIKAEII